MKKAIGFVVLGFLIICSVFAGANDSNMKVNTTYMFGGQNQERIVDVTPVFKAGEDVYMDLVFKVEDSRKWYDREFGFDYKNIIIGIICVRENTNPLLVSNSGIFIKSDDYRKLVPATYFREIFGSEYKENRDGSISCSSGWRYYFVHLNAKNGAGSVRFRFTPKAFFEKADYKTECYFQYVYGDGGEKNYISPLKLSKFNCIFSVAPKDKVFYEDFYGTYVITEDSKKVLGEYELEEFEKWINEEKPDWFDDMTDEEKNNYKKNLVQIYLNFFDYRLTFTLNNMKAKRNTPIDYDEDLGIIYNYGDDDTGYSYESSLRKLSINALVGYNSNGEEFNRWTNGDYIIFSEDFTKLKLYEKYDNAVLEFVFERVSD